MNMRTKREEGREKRRDIILYVKLAIKQRNK
jgi:hypothetical protein